MRRCPYTRCPNLIPPNRRYCDTHQKIYETRRGSSTRRGYGAAHQALRRHWKRLIATGSVTCATCGLLILPTEPWDLGHDETRQNYKGPEHSRCNRAEGGKRGAELRNTQPL